MPLYCYVCHDCDTRAEEFRTVAGRDRGPECSACGASMARDLGAERKSGHGEIDAFWSDSMGVFEESDRRPGETYDADNRLLVRDRQHLKRLKRDLGYRERGSYVE